MLTSRYQSPKEAKEEPFDNSAIQPDFSRQDQRNTEPDVALATNPETVSTKADPESGADQEPLENPDGLTQSSSPTNEPFTESPNSPPENDRLDKHASQDWNENTVAMTGENGNGRIDRARIGTNAKKQSQTRILPTVIRRSEKVKWNWANIELGLTLLSIRLCTEDRFLRFRST